MEYSNNTTVDFICTRVADVDSTDYHLQLSSDWKILDDIFGMWITGLVSVIGITGNILSFVALERAFGINSPMSYVLRALAVCDSVFLSSVMILQTIVNALLKYTTIDTEDLRVVQYTVWPLMMSTQMITVWLTVLVSVERFVAICYPLRAASVCTIRQAKKAVLGVTLISALFNILRYFEFSAGMNKTDMGNDVIYRYVYTCALYALALFLIPLILLLSLNLRVVLTLRSDRHNWQSLRSHQRREQHLTVIPLTIVIVFFICGTPSLIVNISESIWPHLFDCPDYSIYVVIANFLVVLNSASNFIIYFMLGSRFRSHVVRVISCRRSRRDGGLNGRSQMSIKLIFTRDRNPVHPMSRRNALVV